jgi:hypothetical protein
VSVGVVVAFLLGAIAGVTVLYRLGLKYGTRMLKTDASFTRELLDGLGFDTLMRLREAIDDELEKRVAPPPKVVEPREAIVSEPGKRS